MSAFIVGTKTICDCVSAMLPNAATRSHDAAALGRRLIKMNWYAVNSRYKRSDPEPEAIALFKHDDTETSIYMTPLARLAQVLKSLQCLVYQCSEGDTENKFIEYGMARDAARRIAFEIVSHLPEYKNATWGH